ncbi:hypothetical protein H2201_001452 [Coniosporium apollinis]|uniref:TEA domain-containing protein n=1 Tax=Coniosporium apollinis TaxID=61459 RepID=A0ABQ9P4D4_9PEZI|nr:hypothetical protein H2201_001452 [Coniosporium apollinis]
MLPSNAPPLPEELIEDVRATSRVLQERCGNRQHDVLDPEQFGFRKREASSPVENLYSESLPCYDVPELNLAQQLDRRSNEVIEKNSAVLWQNVHKCDAYRKYRSRQPKNSAEREQKWPEHMEAAFFTALVRWPPIGRRKIMHEGKLRGRNELIADSIEKWTGEARTRKQVSSHIQVLKPLFKEHPKVMKHMSKADSGYPGTRHPMSNSSRWSCSHVPRPSTSQYASVSQTLQLPLSFKGNTELPPPLNTLSSNAPRMAPNAFEPFDFEMFMQDRYKNPLRTFTKLHNNPQLPEVQLHEVRHWQKLFPVLESILANGSVASDTILSEASLELMTDPLPEGSELGIRSVFTSNYGLESYEDFECHTQIYDNGTQVDHSKSRIDYNADGSKRLGNLPLGSTWWAHRIVDLTRLLRAARRRDSAATQGTAHSGTLEAPSSHLEEKVRESLRKLSAVQEVYAQPKGHYRQQRLLTICWKFRQANHGESGQTTWRNLLLPTPQIGEELEQRDPFNVPPLDFGSATASTVSQIFDQPPFKLDALSSMAMAGVSADMMAASLAPDMSNLVSEDQFSHHSQLPQDNGIDFTGGHINICMEPGVPMDGYQYTTPTMGYEQLGQYAQPWPVYDSVYEPRGMDGQGYLDGAEQMKDEGIVQSIEAMGDPWAGLRGVGG